MITPILIYFLKVNLALAFLYICYRLLFRDDTFFRLRRGVLLSIYLIAFLYPLPDLSGWLSTQTSVAGIVGYYSGLLPKETVLTASNEIAASDWKEAGLKVMQVIWLAGAGLLLSRCLAELFTVSRLHRKCRKITLNGTEVCILPEAEASYSFSAGFSFHPIRIDGKSLMTFWSMNKHTSANGIRSTWWPVKSSVSPAG